MSDRLKELVQQATTRVNYPTVSSTGKVICDNWEEGISISKLTELLFQECVDNLEFHGLDRARDQIIWLAGNRFGIKVGVKE